MTEEETRKDMEKEGIDDHQENNDDLKWLYEIELFKYDPKKTVIPNEELIIQLINEYHHLTNFISKYLETKYGNRIKHLSKIISHIDYELYIENREDMHNLFQDAMELGFNTYNLEMQKDLRDINYKLNFLIHDKKTRYYERILQNLLIKFPQIIEPNLKFLEKEYNLGNTLYRGDILFLDSTSRKVNVELKVKVPRFKKFQKQMQNYLENIGDNERLMYIAPELTLEQEHFCNNNNIEVKIINLNAILER